MSSPQSAASDTASTNPPDGRLRTIMRGSLTQRMIVIAAAWIFVLLTGGAFALDRVLTNPITRNFDAQLSYALNAMIASRWDEHNSEPQSLMRNTYAVLCVTQIPYQDIKQKTITHIHAATDKQ